MRNPKETQCPSSRALGGATVAKGGALEVRLRPGLEIGIVQSEFPTFQSFFLSGFQVLQLELLKQDQMQWDSSQWRCEEDDITFRAEPDIISQGCLLARPEFEKYGVALVKSKMMHKEGDWNCYRCGNINFQVS